MFRNLILLFIGCAFFSCASHVDFLHKDNAIAYGPVKISSDAKKDLSGSLATLAAQYDPQEKMLTKELTSWNYHTDAQSGTFHEVRNSFSYAVKLLDYGGEENAKRAFDIIEKLISLQDADTTSKTCGIWPYYMEEPLATKKSPPDFNWADFNGVSLLDAIMGHEAEIPDALKPKIKHSLILAAHSIEKRNVGPSYTNIAIMGTYVTYMTAHLFDLAEMKEYARQRLQKFYDYTIERGGFTEYNSPTYTIVALDELNRMKRHIVESGAASMIDSLYAIGWNMIGRHYHKPSGQWAGPHSRAYSALVSPSFYGILRQASNGKIDLENSKQSGDVKIKHEIPTYLLHYFLTPVYPRTETDVFVPDSPKVIGTTYLTPDYVLATANRSSMWNQRHPIMAYWGSIQRPHYLQVRFLHDFYDFSSASFYSQQNENNVLAGINFITNGGDKHISIDKLQDGKFKAKDIRLRFEFGGNMQPVSLNVPGTKDKQFNFSVDDMQFALQLYEAVFGKYKGHWESGSDEGTSWIDYVIYSGGTQDFDLAAMGKAIFGFTLSMGQSKENLAMGIPIVSEKDSTMHVQWEGLNLEVLMQTAKQPRNL